MKARGGSPLERAQRRFARAESLFGDEDWGTGMLDLYYALYFGGQVLLGSKGINPPDHNRLIEALEKDCVGPDMLETNQIVELRRVEGVFHSTDRGATEQTEAAEMAELLEIVRALVALAETMPQEDSNGT